MSELTKREPRTSRTDTIDGARPEVGQWYWVDHEDDKNRWFGCVIRIGSNYIELQSPEVEGGGYFQERIHHDEFWDRCKLEPDPDGVINGRIERYQKKVGKLMGQVKAVTARLAISPSPELQAHSETQALAVRGSGDQDMDGYKAALVKAKDDELPDLFKKIEKANTALAAWMGAKVIPLKAQADGMRDLVDTIEDRIFSVQLYAGLTEEVERVRDGEPAEIGAKIHLMQRRCYMDEECLANYEAGGMEFADLGEFDQWLARDDNFNRILPFPRCIVSFRVRRNTKDREVTDLSSFFRIIKQDQADRFTFLYIRNGDQLFRMSTKLEFDEKLFPDLDKAQLDEGQIWAKMFGDRVDKLLSDNEYQGLLEEYQRELKQWKAYEKALKSPEAKARAKADGKKRPDASHVDVPYCWRPSNPATYDTYVPFNKGDVHYDDIAKMIADEIKQHNRIALILQGLLDRSPVLHPHPPWQIWTNDGFEAALELVYDESRTLPAGPKPDFEAYRQRCNASLRVGSVTVGQEDAWEIHEAEKECRRRDNDWRDRGSYRPERWTPMGNPGPGRVARVTKYGKRARRCSYAWERERQTERWKGDTIRTTFTTEAANLLNIDAYRPGDFHQFFDDPRTRAEYLEWAPLLLTAEDYHAGKIAKLPEPPKPERKKGSSLEGRIRYQQRKRRNQLMGKTVRLTEQIKTEGGDVYKVGTLWEVTDGRGDEFTIRSAEGPDDEPSPYIRCVPSSYLELVEDS
jgi:hypothetical protein